MVLVDNQLDRSSKCELWPKERMYPRMPKQKNLEEEQKGYFTSVFGTGLTTAGMLCSVQPAIQGC